ncbi:aminotransferase [Hesseltinella vesiculosa]|uniref:Aminotransferase n=1 Tax=Hesseltinella vesiculosa TaxID=101127 RepID=A0A1X2GRJ8_9FUNG|nr:aminotransferase [Hesseltinella vesiculosa]
MPDSTPTSRPGTPKHHLYDIAQRVVEQIRTEKDSAAHQAFRSSVGNAVDKAPTDRAHGIEHPASTGVIYVMDRANKLGYSYGDPAWANFGQGAPEVGHIDGCLDKPTQIDLPLDTLEYAPTTGIKPLREKIANLYNELYRKDKESKYTFENVCVVPGGRAGLTRVASAIANIQVGYFLPEYTAYEQMLSIFKRFVPIPTPLDEDSNYHIDPDMVEREIRGRGLSMIVSSNPRNPSGGVVAGEELEKLAKVGRDRHCTLVMDEFYSSYIYTPEGEEQQGDTVSITSYVQDVNKDGVIVIDGLTKNYRLPGWRICWIVAPKDIISAMASSGSFTEGGANHPLQVAAVPLLDPALHRQEAKALQIHFRKKRDYVVERLRATGFKIKEPPQATFYMWLDLSCLPSPINIGLNFFEECLKEKTIVVPGLFFDVNPSHRRELFDSPCHHFVRLSFGPPLEELKKGLDGIDRVVKKFTKPAHRVD